MSNWPFRRRRACSRALQALALGLACGVGLCCANVCLVASFDPTALSTPYWKGVPGLRTDTCGIAALLAAAICFTTSEYLRLRRLRQGLPGRRRPTGATGLVVRAISETVAIVATGLVIYVSVNSVTHPATLDLQASHLATRPTEGTVRVVALLLCTCSVTVLRYLQIGSAPERGARMAVSSRVTCDGRYHASHDGALCAHHEANGSGPQDAVLAASAQEARSVPANEGE
jgi:hypothetical protein